MQASFEGYTKFGGFAGPALFYEFDYNEIRDEQWERGDIFLVKDFYDPAIRLQIGDVVPNPTAFQQVTTIGGFSLSREYRTMKPFENLRSSGRGSLTLERDSEVDVFVNGVLTETLDLPAGSFDLVNFPAANGANDVRLEVRDSFGRTESTRFSFYSETELLAEDLLDFSIAFGAPRKRSGAGYEYDFEDWQVSGFANYGITSSFNLGVNGQFSEERNQVGLSGNFGTPAGVFGVDTSVSHDASEVRLSPTETTSRDNWGHATSLTHRNQFKIGGTPVNWNSFVSYRSSDFTGLQLQSSQSSRWTANTSLSARMAGNTNLTFGANYSDFYGDRPERFRSSIGLNKTFDRWTASISAEYAETGSETETAILAGLSYRMGARNSLRARYNSLNEQKSFEFQRSRRTQLNDLSGRLRYDSTDGVDSWNAIGDFYHNRFEASAEYSNRESRNLGDPRQERVRLQGSSFLGFTDGKLAIGRTSPEGFIITSRHASISQSKLRMIAGTGDIAESETGLLGPALTPIRRSYIPRQFRADATGLPDNYSLGSDDFRILPSPGAGYHYRVGTDASRSVMGIMLQPNGEPVSLLIGKLLNGKDEDEPTEIEFFTNKTGRFVIEGLAPGKYRVQFEDTGETEFEITPNQEGLINVGQLQLQ